ncbi:MAG TPA: sigma-70 family RNA polymerase sigma factor [Prolixibacteraceae bacterium]|nr:sigma-70 family RNA polymerase sigma factor [Prolixibacteraceae bacterium]
MSTESIFERLNDPAQKREAFHDLVVSHQQKLYWHIRKIVLNHDDAHDLLQNVFMKAWSSLDRFRGESSLSTWLYRIATNESLTFLNQQKRKRGFVGDADEAYLSNRLKSDSFFDGNEIQRRLMEAVVKLPEKQRLVFNMKYFDNLKYEQMAEILNLTTGALKASYHHAVKKIEESLRNDPVF